MTTAHNINKSGKPSMDKPWLAYYSEDALKLSVPSETIFEFLLKKNHDYPNDIAIIYQNTKICYADLFRHIDRCAQALTAMGVKRNDIVTIGMKSSPEVVYLVFALNRIGAVANLIHPQNDTETLCQALEEVGSELFFISTDSSMAVRGIIKKTSGRKIIIVSPSESLHWSKKLYYRRNICRSVKATGSAISWKLFIKKGSGTELPPPQRADNDYATITHTGGTTGSPKGVICTNKNILATILQSLIDRPYERQDCMMSVLPPFINYSLVNTILEPLCSGLKTLLISDYNPINFVEYLKQYHVNHIISIPAYWNVLLSIPNITNYDFSQLGFICSGGEYLDPFVEREVNRILKAGGAKTELMKGTGMTETTSVVASTYPWCNPTNSVGIPCVLNNCKIIDVDNGEELGYGESGEICFSGPTVMAAYHNQPSATDDIIHIEDGVRWLHTGDIGYMREDGAIFICGRLKRIIMQKDENGIVSKIFPEQIEKVIDCCNGIKSSCVIGIHHNTQINILKVFVEPEKSTSSLEKRTFLNWCRDNLPSYMVPQEVEFITAMPRTERGKIDYRALEKQHTPSI